MKNLLKKIARILLATAVYGFIALPCWAVNVLLVFWTDNQCWYRPETMPTVIDKLKGFWRYGVCGKWYFYEVYRGGMIALADKSALIQALSRLDDRLEARGV
jgi:hypothetical protein